MNLPGRYLGGFLLALIANPALAQGQRLDLHGDPLPPGAVARLGTIRLRPGTTVKMLAFSPDGKTLASYAQEQNSTPVNFLSFWEVATGKELRRVDLLHGQIHALTWPAKGPAWAVGKPYQFYTHYQLWDVADGKNRPPDGLVPPGKVKYKELTGIALSGNGSMVAGGGKGLNDEARPIHVWDKLSTNKFELLPNPRTLGDQPCEPEWLGFTGDQRLLVAINRLPDAKDFELAVWDLAKGVEITTARIPRPYRNRMHFTGGVAALTPDNKSLALGMEEGRVLMFDLSTGKESANLTLAAQDKMTKRTPSVSALAFAVNHSYMIAGLTNGEMVQWDLAKGKEVWRVAAHRFGVDVLALSADGTRVASGGYEGVIRIADTATGADVCPQTGNNGWLWHARVSPDGRTAASHGLDRQVKFWDLAQGKWLPNDKFPKVVEQVDYLTADHQLVLSKGKLALFSQATGKMTEVEGELARAAATRFRWLPDTKTMATFQDQHIFLYDWPSGKLRQTMALPLEKDPKSPKIQHVDFEPNGKRTLAVTFSYTGNRQTGIFLWDHEQDAKPRQLPISFVNFHPIIFSPDGMGLLIPTQGYTFQAEPFGKWEDALRLVDATQGNILRSFIPPKTPRNETRRYVRGVVPSPDGRTLASLEEDQTVVLFETATGLVRKHLVGHRGNVLGADFTPDGKRLITCGQDNTALVWDLSMATLANQPPKAAEVGQAWKDLTGRDADKVRQALATLASFSKETLAQIEANLSPRPRFDEIKVTKLIDQLDSQTFAEREKALAELDNLADAPVVIYRATLAKNVPLETTRRLQRLIDKYDPSEPTGFRLREMRAVEVLEQLATPEARKLLNSLAAGAPSSRLTLDAAAALRRLELLAKSNPNP